MDKKRLPRFPGQPKRSTCAGGKCNCGGLDRRDFLKIMGATAAGAMLASSAPVMAGPFTAADFEKIIPTDKKLHAEWVKALFARGARAAYRGADLDKIGMPVGGICAGQVYLGGDGSLWHWDIFNKHMGTGSANYVKPPQPESPFAQGFAIKVVSGEKAVTRTLDSDGFDDITFCGEYPLGFVDYKDPALPVTVALEAFSPFIPLAAEDSSLPATIMRYSVRNVSGAPVEVELAGWLQNAVCLNTPKAEGRKLHNRILRPRNLALLECTAEGEKPTHTAAARPPVVFADFEGADYGDWKVEGTAFGKGPVQGSPDRKTQKLTGFRGKQLVNTWQRSDASTGKLTSPEFTIERPFINFLIGGGNKPKQTCINLVVEDKVVRTATGADADALEWANWDVADLKGKAATIEIVDTASGAWGHIDIDQIEFADTSRLALPFARRPDYGTMTLALLDGPADAIATAALATPDSPEDSLFDAADAAKSKAEGPLGEPLVGALGRRFQLAPGAEAAISFAVTWHFPNWTLSRLQDLGGHAYATRFTGAGDVAQFIARNYASLYRQTRLWHDTWYDSTLPRWFLDRTFLNTSTLATSVCHRTASGRFWAWEGVGCCHGTCTHVWHYAQAVGRIFPEIERGTRERVDLGISFEPTTGVMGFRGEFDPSLAVDGQSGTLLRIYREHLMSPDATFLRRNWMRIRKAYEPLLALDEDGDGILSGAQMNTLDRPWFGKVAWLSGIYLAALAAGEAMAREMGDTDFAETCRAITGRGGKAIDKTLFNGEYYYHIPDPENAKSVGSFNGCEIDQVLGESWLRQVGLGGVLPQGNVKTALASLYKYNFTPDVGPFREKYKEGRVYAVAGEGGLIMCTWPKGDEQRQKGNFDYYFNECMSGFEHQAAGHMIWEGLVQEGLAVVRAIHDRYHPGRRNPWNEVECGDHYSRAMASYGVFLAACGYEYHGPQGHLGFAPRLEPGDFRAAFTAAEGWGTLSQRVQGKAVSAGVEVKWGKLRLRTLALALPAGAAPATVELAVAGDAAWGAKPGPLKATHAIKDGRLLITLPADVTLRAGQRIEVKVA